MKVAIPFWGGGGNVKGSRNLGGSSLPLNDLLPRTVQMFPIP